jgi:hypothetical protein
MKITISRLRSLIREAMITTLPPGVVVVVDQDARSISISMIESGKAHGPGNITLHRIQSENGNIWEVVNSVAKKGYGPLFYDIAMEYVVGRLGDLGITSDTSTMVSGEATRVWDFYLNNRPDVEKEFLPDNFLHAKDRKEPFRYYYYKVETPYLDRLEEENVIKYK